NYDRFPAGLENLETLWPDRSVHVISEFRPGNVPVVFSQEIANTLAQHLSSPPHLVEQPAGATFKEIAISLSWGATPRDLDLFVRVVRHEGTWVICFRDRGRWTDLPFAELDRDVTTGSGPETVKVRAEGLRSLSIAVHSFSNETPLSASQAS